MEFLPDSPRPEIIGPCSTLEQIMTNPSAITGVNFSALKTAIRTIVLLGLKIANQTPFSSCPPLGHAYATAKKGGRESKSCALLELYSTCAMQGEEQVSWVKSSLQAELSVSLA